MASLWLLTVSVENGSAQEMEVAILNEGLQWPSWVQSVVIMTKVLTKSCHVEGHSFCPNLVF